LAFIQENPMADFIIKRAGIDSEKIVQAIHSFLQGETTDGKS
jgi:hypothetical protein